VSFVFSCGSQPMSDVWAPPPVDDSLKAAYIARARKPKRGILSGAASGLFEAKRQPGPHDWLNGPGVKDRKGQTYAQWNMERRRRPKDGDVIRLVPLGDLDPEELDVEWLCQCVRCFFTGMEVEVLPAVPTKDLLKTITHRENDYGTQLLTTDIHRLLDSMHGKRKGTNAFATMAFSMFDLYPKPEWNFVFGQAKPFVGTGVFSFARYRAHDRNTFHMRCAKVLCHELGHLFGLSHCVWFQCLMCGSNGDWESDQHPVHVCPVCLAKIDAALGGVDLIAREASLEQFWRDSGFETEAGWCQRRREAMEQSRPVSRSNATHHVEKDVGVEVNKSGSESRVSRSQSTCASRGAEVEISKNGLQSRVNRSQSIGGSRRMPSKSRVS
jgi:archaemetzincin